MQSFIPFANALEPGFSGRIEGATTQEIQDFEKLVGQALPPHYRAFLTAMGHATGGLRLAWECDTDVREVMDFYREEMETGMLALPPDCILIGVGGIITEEVGLDMAANDEDPPVILVNGGRSTGRLADGLRQLLYRQAFIQWAARKFAYRRQVIGEQVHPIIDTAETLLGHEGITSESFSDSIALCAQRTDLVLFLVQYEGDKPSAVISGAQPNTVDQLAAKLEHGLGLHSL